jgi:hypothetical protein
MPPPTAESILLKLRVKREVASSFKLACAGLGIAADDEIARLMASRCGLNLDAPSLLSVDNRAHRRKAVRVLLQCLEKILSAESAYIENVPDNFQDSENTENAELSAEALSEAISILEDAY